MKIEVELFDEDDNGYTVKLPAKWEVCRNCDGNGTHVARGIDSHGLTREDFDADPQFEEDYFAGRYDVQCDECKGRTTVLVVDRDECDQDDLRQYDLQMEEEAEYRRLCAWERKMGC